MIKWCDTKHFTSISKIPPCISPRRVNSSRLAKKGRFWPIWTFFIPKSGTAVKHSKGQLKNFQNSTLVLTGNGSNLFDKNSFHLDIKYNFAEINFYEENDSEICNAGYNFDKSENNEMKFLSKSKKKLGFFEKFFNLFSR